MYRQLKIGPLWGQSFWWSRRVNSTFWGHQRTKNELLKMTGSQTLIYSAGTKNRVFLIDLMSILLGVQKGQLKILGGGVAKDQKRTFKDDWISEPYILYRH